MKKKYISLGYDRGMNELSPDFFYYYMQERIKDSVILSYSYNGEKKLFSYRTKYDKSNYVIDFSDMSEEYIKSILNLVNGYVREVVIIPFDEYNMVYDSNPVLSAIKVLTFLISAGYEISIIIRFIFPALGAFTLPQLVLSLVCAILVNILNKDIDVVKFEALMAKKFNKRFGPMVKKIKKGFRKTVSFVKNIFHTKSNNYGDIHNDIYDMSFAKSYMDDISVELSKLDEIDKKKYNDLLTFNINEYRNNLNSIPNLSISREIVDAMRKAFIRELVNFKNSISSNDYSSSNSYEFKHQPSPIYTIDPEKTLDSNGVVRLLEKEGQ